MARRKIYRNITRIPVDPRNRLTPAEIERICCDPNTPVDPCSEVGKVSPWYGYRPDELDIEIGEQPDNWTGNVRYVGVGPDGPCGRLIEKWEGRNRCCEGVPPLEIDEFSTGDVLPPGQAINIFVDGGQLPLTFTSSNMDTLFENGRREITVNQPVARLIANNSFCGTTRITVEDGCSEDEIYIRSTVGQWVKIGNVCRLEGVAGQTYTANRFIETISGRYRQLEEVSRVSAFRIIFCNQNIPDDSQIQCVPPIAGSCNQAILERMLRYHDEEFPTLAMDTCLGVDMSEIVITAITIYGYDEDGSIIFRHNAAQQFTCNYPNANFSGSVDLTGYQVAHTVTIELFEWVCP